MIHLLHRVQVSAAVATGSAAVATTPLISPIHKAILEAGEWSRELLPTFQLLALIISIGAGLYSFHLGKKIKGQQP